MLRAATAYPNGEIVLMANGKTFAENGSRVLIRTSLPERDSGGRRGAGALEHEAGRLRHGLRRLRRYQSAGPHPSRWPALLPSGCRRARSRSRSTWERAAAPRAPSLERAMNCRRSFRARKTAPSTIGARITGRRTANTPNLEVKQDADGLELVRRYPGGCGGGNLQRVFPADRNLQHRRRALQVRKCPIRCSRTRMENGRCILSGEATAVWCCACMDITAG